MATVTYETTPDEIKAQDNEKITKMQLELDSAQAAIEEYRKLL
jgi:hypothetical protein